MRVTFRSGDIIAGRAVNELTVGLGRKFVLKLGDVTAGSRIEWTTQNDPVLDLREADDKMSAKVKATELGKSIIYIRAKRHIVEELAVHVTVVPMNDTTGEAVTLNGSIGQEEPDTEQ